MGARYIHVYFFVACSLLGVHRMRISAVLPTTNTIPLFEPTVVHKWVTIDYNRPANMTYHRFRMTYPYDYRNSVLGGIKVYKGEIYVTVPRISPGVSATLNRVIEKDGKSLLEAFPDWSWQTIGDCDALQTVSNIEIDPVKGWMWIADTGRVNTFWGGVRDLCQAKLIIYDLNEGKVVKKYVFPEHVTNISDAFLSDIVIDPEAGYAFLPNTVVGNLIFFSLNDNFSIAIDHPLFKFEKGNNSITVNERTIILSPASANIYGVAMSPRRDYILFSHLGGHGVYRISTNIFRKLVKDPDLVSEVGKYITRLGYKVSQSRGLLLGHDRLYYGALGRQAVYGWELKDLLSSEPVPEDILGRIDQSTIVADDRMYWIDTMTLDSEGVLWITSSNLVRYFLDDMDYHNIYNYFIWKVYIGENSYIKKKTSMLEIPIVMKETVEDGHEKEEPSAENGRNPVGNEKINSDLNGVAGNGFSPCFVTFSLVCTHIMLRVIVDRDIWLVACG